MFFIFLITRINNPSSVAEIVKIAYKPQKGPRTLGAHSRGSSRGLDAPSTRLFLASTPLTTGASAGRIAKIRKSRPPDLAPSNFNLKDPKEACGAPLSKPVEKFRRRCFWQGGADRNYVCKISKIETSICAAL